jgi:DNA-binding transcriptional MocR family regulator
MKARGSVYMRWAKEHAAARHNLANSGLLECAAADLELGPADLRVSGPNFDGFRPLLEAIAERYGAAPEQVMTAPGTSGANFLAFATLVEPGDEVLIEQPAYEPLLAALSWLGARLRRFRRRHEDGWGLDPDEVRAQLEAAGGGIHLIVLTNPHNPSGVLAPAAAVAEIGRFAERAGALVLVEEGAGGDSEVNPGPPVSPQFRRPLARSHPRGCLGRWARRRWPSRCHGVLSRLPWPQQQRSTNMWSS